MKKLILYILFAVTCFNHGFAQRPVGKSSMPALRNTQTISFLPLLPLGVFQRTHLLGAGLSYAWSRHHFGPVATAQKKLGLVLQGEMAYYLGKKTTTAGYPFRFANYADLSVHPGMIYNPWANVGIMLTGGPSVGIYAGNANLGWGANLEGQFYFPNRIGLGPVLAWRKETKNTDALLALGVRASWYF